MLLGIHCTLLSHGRDQFKIKLIISGFPSAFDMFWRPIAVLVLSEKKGCTGFVLDQERMGIRKFTLFKDLFRKVILRRFFLNKVLDFFRRYHVKPLWLSILNAMGFPKSTDPKITWRD